MKVEEDDAIHDVDRQGSERDIKKAFRRLARVKSVHRG